MVSSKYGNFNGKRSFNTTNDDAIDEGLGYVHCTRAMGRKRIVVSNCIETIPPTKKRLVVEKNKDGGRDSCKSLLEALPQDILVHVLCFVNHEDLKQLVQVSKSISEATLIAKQCHFAYSTPRAKRINGLRSDLEVESPKSPNAPRRKRCAMSRINEKKLSDICIALLFNSSEDELWSKCSIR